jgi:transposase
MARGKGKRYDETFKQETVKYILDNNKPVAQVARETGINDNTLHGWVKKYSRQPEIKAIQTFATPDAELRAMQG